MTSDAETKAHDAETKAQAQNAVDPEDRREDKKLTAEELASIAGGEEGSQHDEDSTYRRATSLVSHT